MALNNANQKLAALLRDHEERLLAQWSSRIITAGGGATGMQQGGGEIIIGARNFLDDLITRCSQEGEQQAKLDAMERSVQFVRFLATRWAERGFPPGDAAKSVLALKGILRGIAVPSKDVATADLLEALLLFTDLLEDMSLNVFEAYSATREEIILQQSNSLMELSTPAVKLWENMILLPLVGVIDTARSQQLIEQLLEAIVKYEALVAILDITGVPVIDTRVAHHLMRAVAAAKMLGAEVVMTGISPEAALTIVKLDVGLGTTRTRGTLGASIIEAFRMLGLEIVKRQGEAS